jgi:hypothetical protein
MHKSTQGHNMIQGAPQRLGFADLIEQVNQIVLVVKLEHKLCNVQVRVHDRANRALSSIFPRLRSKVLLCFNLMPSECNVMGKQERVIGGSLTRYHHHGADSHGQAGARIDELCWECPLQ